MSDAAKAINQRLYGVDTPAQAIAKYQPGGVIYYTTRNNDDNIGDPAQVATLSNGLQAAVAGSAGPHPAADLGRPGGRRARGPVRPAGDPDARQHGAGRGPLGGGRARRSAEVIGTELAAVGVTQDYAPVADVNINPNNPVIGIRSIGGDADLVSDLASAQVKGYHAGGVSAVAKHFPGHGDTGVDSHFGLPEVTHTPGAVDAIDLPPFRAAIAAGVDTIMTAHVVFPAVDPRACRRRCRTRSSPGCCATSSVRRPDRHRRARHGGRDGDVPAGRGPRAGDPRRRRPAAGPAADGHGVRRGARRGPGRRDQQEAARRVGLPDPAAQVPRGIFGDPIVDPAAAPQIMGAPQHLADAQAITDHTTTLVKNDAGLLPLAAGPRNVLVAGWGVGTTQGIATALGRAGRDDAGPRVRDHADDRRAIDAAVAAAQDSDLVVVSTNNAYAVGATTGQPTAAAAAQTRLVRALLATGKPVVVAAMRNPYDVASFPEAPTVLDTYGYTAHQIESLVRVLFGEVNPTGRLPVSIPRADGTGELFPFGHGLGY